jgi:hypothetical protein
MRTTLALFVITCGVGGFGFAQTSDVQQLPDAVKQSEQLTEELKARPAATEEWQTVSPQVTNASIAQPVSVDNPPQPTISVSPEATKPKPAESPSKPANAPGDDDKAKVRLDIYGFAMLDMGYDVDQNDPLWFDVMRPTKLPSSPNQFGQNGNFYSGVRQTRFGVKGYFQTPLGELKTVFEWELFGVGVDAGQTTFRLRQAWGELGPIGAGQSWSPFMDPDVFPNSLEYWGPNGMVFFRNVQARWMPINKGNHQLWFALERPGASGDLGTAATRIELQNIQGRFLCLPGCNSSDGSENR